MAWWHTIDDHNGGQYLEVAEHTRVKNLLNALEVYHLKHQSRTEGWYVIRTCPCHQNEPVSIAYPTRQEAERVRAKLLEVSASLGT
jgi:hypothetical protein